jgi:hypothetical protein
MPDKIPLPKLYKGINTKAHPFPFQIAMQTQKFTQGAIFYFTLMDEAAGLFFRQGGEGAYGEIEKLFLINYGYSKTTWDTSWPCFEEYLTVFPNQIRQLAIILMKSHWDWYISHLGNFIIFALKNKSNLSPNLKAVKKIGFKNFNEQLTILEKATGINFDLEPATLDSLSELSLVRNLGIHNQWEVDETYLKWSKNKNWKKGEIRAIAIEELEDWRKGTIEAINKTYQPIAIKYIDAPEFIP